MIGSPDDFGVEPRQDFRQRLLEDWSRIGAVSKELFKKRELTEKHGQQHDAPVTILNVCGMHNRVQQQAQRIN